MAAIEVNLVSNREEAIKAKDEAIERALEIIGQVAERYAKELCPADTGRLRNSISHDVDAGEPAVYVGTNVEYAPYVEFGTGRFAEGGGRETPWSYQDSDGNWHTTVGMKPRPYLRPAVANHIDQYKQIVQNELKSE